MSASRDEPPDGRPRRAHPHRRHAGWVSAIADFCIRLDPGESRRNLTTRGVRLNELVGKEFWIGEVVARGVELCEPCTHLVRLTGKQLIKPLTHRGGLRADLLTSGRINV